MLNVVTCVSVELVSGTSRQSTTVAKAVTVLGRLGFMARNRVLLSTLCLIQVYSKILNGFLLTSTGPGLAFMARHPRVTAIPTITITTAVYKSKAEI